MGNTGSSSSGGRRRPGSRPSHPPPMQPETAPNRNAYPAATPYPSQYPNPNPSPPQYYQYPPELFRPAPPETQIPPPYLPAPYDHHHRAAPAHSHWVGGRYPSGAVALPPPYVEHQKAVSIRNDINVKKESLRIVADEESPGKFLVTFTFDATVDGCITIVFFAKEGEDCSLIPTKPDILPPMTVQFQQGLGQKYTQPSGTGIDLSAFEETELLRSGDQDDIYPLAVKAQASSNESGSRNSQTTQATFKKEKGEYKLRVVKQILWVNGMRYELQEIYGIGNSVEADGTDPGKECVICLSEPRDTTVLPCRHMCMCSGCAKVLRFQTDKCPICRNPVERLLEIKVRDSPADDE